jgi:hypothetical protein
MESKNAVKAVKLMAAGFILVPSLAMAQASAIGELNATAGSDAASQATAVAAPPFAAITAGNVPSAAESDTRVSIAKCAGVATVPSGDGAGGKLNNGATELGSITVEVFELSKGALEADVEVQQVRDSYPVLHFKNLAQSAPPVGNMGGSTIYKGKGFELSIVPTALDRPGTLTVGFLDLKTIQLKCN